MTEHVLSPAMRARYGVDHRSPLLTVGVATVVVVFAAVLGWVGWHLATPSVQASLLGFKVIDSTRVDVRLDVVRDGSTETVCVIRAQDVHHSDVGYATVTIGRGRDRVSPTYPLATLAQATTAELLGCEEGVAPRVDPPSFLPGTTNPPQVPTLDGS